MGGGTAENQLPTLPQSGLSPRGRGNRLAGGSYSAAQGSIPAWAGEPSSSVSTACLTKVYPRVGGGTHAEASRPMNVRGLSPRGRGNHHDPVLVHVALRSIPAWAGEPRSSRCCCRCRPVYPRVGGGTDHVDKFGFILGGLSPRGRGNRGLYT